MILEQFLSRNEGKTLEFKKNMRMEADPLQEMYDSMVLENQLAIKKKQLVIKWKISPNFGLKTMPI